MKTFALISLLLTYAAIGSRAELPAGWSTNYSLTLSNAAAESAPAVVYFTASWCGPCKLMARLTLTNSDVVQALASVGNVAVDIDEHSDLARTHGVDAVPTFIMLSPTGDEVQRTTGFQSAPDFLQWLTNGIAEAKAAAIRHRLAQEKIAEIDRLLASDSSNAIPAAAAKLFELCGERDESITRIASDRLNALAARNPAALLDGMNDPRLATRIRVANALHSRFGNKFDFDPWGNPATRAAAVRQWRAKLSENGISK